MRVTFSAQARADLVQIARYIQRAGSRRGASFVRELRATCLNLATHPGRHPTVSERTGRKVRRAIHGNYLVFYVVGVESIQIVRVLHAARDVESLFPDD